MLYLIIGVALILATGILWFVDCKTAKFSRNLDTAISSIRAITIGYWVVLSLLCGFRGCANMDIQNYYALKETIPLIRQNTNQFENMQLQKEIIENNKCLRLYQYLNKVWLLELAIPDKMDSLKILH